MFKLTAAIAFVSASALMFEVSLARLLSIAHGQELSYMVISLALLGYGLATPFLSRLRRIRNSEPSKWPLALSISIPLILASAHFISIDSQRLAWEISPWLQVMFFYFLFTIPFLFAGLTIASLLSKMPEKSFLLYSGDLVGAGIGALLPFFFLPFSSCWIASLLSAAGGILLAKDFKQKIAGAALGGLAIFLTIFKSADFFELKFSPSRGLPTALLEPGAKLKETHWSPWTRIDIFSAAAARVAPGLSLNYLSDIPRFDGIAVDGDQIFPRINDDPEYYDLSFLDDLAQALPYSLIPQHPSVLLIHTQGGVELFEAVFHRAFVELIEKDKLFRRVQFPTYSGWHIVPVRHYLSRKRQPYDFIVIGHLGGGGALSTGMSSMRQDFNLTVETLRLAYQNLTDRGFIVVHLFRLPPERLEYRLVNTMIESLKKSGVEDPEKHLSIVRSLQTYTFLMSRNPISQEILAKIKDFCNGRGFELIFPLGGPSQNGNLFSDLIARKDIGTPFLLDPITDDRPFPEQSLRLKNIKKIVAAAKGHWQIVLEGGGWSFVIFIQTILASLLILAFSGIKRSKNSLNLYFLAIGFGFIFVEIGWMQRLSVSLTHHAQSVPIVLGGMLIGGGIGSRIGEWMKRKSLPVVACAISALVSLFSVFFLKVGIDFLSLAAFSTPILFFAVVFFSIPLGIPFPSMLSQLKDPQKIAWLWGVNACASVCGAVLAAALAPMVGFTSIFLISSGCYLLAALASVLSRSSAQI